MESFKYAFEGLAYIFKSQRNFKVHITVALAAVILAYFLSFTPVEWTALFIIIGLVLTAEAFNTAIEKAVDCATKEFDPNAKMAKDSAAAAVLIMSFAAVAIGVVLFGLKLMNVFFS